jgi:hypothetical protein
VIITEQQRRWWFATHPEFSWGNTGEGTGGDYDDDDADEGAGRPSPESVDAWANERLTYETDNIRRTLVELAKYYFGTEFQSKTPAEKEAILEEEEDATWDDDELSNAEGNDWWSQQPADNREADQFAERESHDDHARTWKESLEAFVKALKEVFDPQRTKDLVVGALMPTGRGHFLKIETLKKTEVIARGTEIREVRDLVRKFGGRAKNWIKWKGEGDVLTPRGTLRRAEIHWYEHHGIGKREVKWSRWLD